MARAVNGFERDGVGRGVCVGHRESRALSRVRAAGRVFQNAVLCDVCGRVFQRGDFGRGVRACAGGFRFSGIVRGVFVADEKALNQLPFLQDCEEFWQRCLPQPFHFDP